MYGNIISVDEDGRGYAFYMCEFLPPPAVAPTRCIASKSARGGRGAVRMLLPLKKALKRPSKCCVFFSEEDPH